MLTEPEDRDLGVAVFLQGLVGLVAAAAFEEPQFDGLAHDGGGLRAERFHDAEQGAALGLGRAGLELGDADGHARDLRIGEPVLEARVLREEEQQRRAQQSAVEEPAEGGARAMDDPLGRLLVEGDADAGVALGEDAEPPGLVYVGDEARPGDGFEGDYAAAIPDDLHRGDAEADRGGEVVERGVEVFDGVERCAAEGGDFVGGLWG